MRHWDVSGESAYRCWKMPCQEAEDLARWWQREGARFKDSDPPILNRSFGSVLVSMFTPSLVHAYGLDPYGRKQFAGYSLPQAMMDALAVWAAVDIGEHSKKPVPLKKESKA